MSGLEMKRVDLGELYGLLEMYERTYGGVPEELLEGIAAAYKRQGGTGTMTYQQYRAVRRLVHSCCNHQDGNCLLLDDGEE